MTGLDVLRELKADTLLTAGTIFDALFEAGSKLTDGERDTDEALEIAIRLLEAQRNKQVPQGCEEAIAFLAEECGLYPYIDPQKFNHLTQTVIEAHAIKLKSKLYLHSKQMQVLLWLLDGDNVILSAPTSFGKTLLVDAFIALKQPNTVVVILPTIALIDECRRRLSETFGDRYDIITSVNDAYVAGIPTVFVLTQERFLQRKDDIAIDFLFIDEFYKLDPSRGDSRFETLNLALYLALPHSRQTFMAGPHIREINLGQDWKGNFRFIRTDYRTVTVNIIDRSNAEERLTAFLDDLRDIGEDSSLVFTQAPGTALKLMEAIIDTDISYPTAMGTQLRDWIAENYHKDWPVAIGNERGIAIHHGRLPRSLGQLFVHLFNEGIMKVLICTSTLIEGVNTSAANVFIYDKTINRTDFDFFSFANIRGRVGRMMRHFVGNAFLYHEAPAVIETRVEVPVLADPNGATDYLLMNINRSELSDTGRNRQDLLPIDSGLSAALLKEHAGLGVPLLQSLSLLVQTAFSNDPDLLLWSGFPSQEQRIALADPALHVTNSRRERSGLFTGKQIAWAWDSLRRMSTLSKFLRWFARMFERDDRAKGVERAFQFLQACEFNFPRVIAAINDMVLSLAPASSANYGVFIVGLENWFRPTWMKELDEAGIPLPLAERLRPHLKTPANRRDALDQISNLQLDEPNGFSAVDRFIVELAIGRAPSVDTH